MNVINYILAATVLFSSVIHAEEKTTEVSIQAIEIEHFIVNWSPNDQDLGRAIVYRCADCTPTTMTFNKDTELLINGEIRPIEDISSKVDWSGLITVTDDAPTKIIKIRIY